MRLIVFSIIIFFLINSCSFKSLNPKEFNEKIAGRTDIKTPAELIKLYYDYPGSKISIKTYDLGGNKYKIILIDENLEDDSQSAQQIVMYAIITDQTWRVIELKVNWKCHWDRGHSYWGTGRCN